MDKELFFEKPQYDLEGNKIKDNICFFKYPSNIGKILYAYSNFYENAPLKSEKKEGFFSRLFSSNYIYDNIFIGEKGIAYYEMKNKIDNLTINEEILFEEITDLYSMHTDNIRGFIYEGTSFSYVLANRFNKDSNIIYEISSWYNKKNIDSKNDKELFFGRAVEKAWTLYLIKNIDNILMEKGYLSFVILEGEKLVEYIRLSRESITFIKDGGKEEFTYYTKDIKNMYRKGNELYIEHNNFEKKMFLFNSGNKDVIPLSALLNRDFFFYALELLLGYR